MNEPTDRVRAVWAHRTAAEYRSAAISSELLHWSLILGAPPDLVERLRITIGEELEHAERSRAVHAAAGGGPEDVRIPAEDLSSRLFVDQALPRRAVASALQELAFHEAIALDVFRAMTARPLVPVVRGALTTIVRDEARHRRLGWTLTQWLLEQRDERPWLRPRVGALLHGITTGYAASPEPTDAEARWGLLGGSQSARVVRRTIDGNISRNLARLELR